MFDTLFYFEYSSTSLLSEPKIVDQELKITLLKNGPLKYYLISSFDNQNQFVLSR